MHSLHQLVNQKHKQTYKFPTLDRIKITNSAFILDIVGQSDSLKTRFAAYLCNGLIENENRPVYWISTKSFDQQIMNQEIKNPDKLTVIFENEAEAIYKILMELPSGSDVFIDSIFSIKVNKPELAEKPFLTMGKVLANLISTKFFRFYITSTVSGFDFQPITEVFRHKIKYRVEIKKMKSKKDFVGINYLPIGHFYRIIFNESLEQFMYAGITEPLDPDIVSFFYLLSVDTIKKVNRTYWAGETKLGQDVFNIIEKNRELIRNLTEHIK